MIHDFLVSKLPAVDASARREQLVILAHNVGIG